MAVGRAPSAIVLALGAGALGGPDALRALLDFAGRESPVVDIAICVFVIGMATAQILGVVLLARFVVRKPPRARARARPRAPATDRFAGVTLVVSVGVAFLVTACLVVVSGGGGGLVGSARVVFDFAGFLLLCVTSLLRVLREAGNADGGSGPAARATETRTVGLSALPLVGICLLLDALRHFPARSINTFAGVAALTIVGIVLLARFSRRSGNGAGAAPAPPATDTAARFAKRG